MGAIGDPYITPEELKRFVGSNAANTGLEDILAMTCDAASREIERFTNRQFNRVNEASSRFYTVEDSNKLAVDDFWTLDDLVVEVKGGEEYDEQTVTGDMVYPLNGIESGQPGFAFHTIRDGGFPLGATVRVTAKWGWEKVPEPIKQAAFMLASEGFKMKDTPLGVAGADAFGSIIRVRENKIVQNKIQRYARHRILVG